MHNHNMVFTQSAVILLTSLFIISYGSPTTRSPEVNLNNTQPVVVQIANRTDDPYFSSPDQRAAFIEALILLRQRQDEDGGLENVAQILSGALGGSGGLLGNIFQGSSGFIGNTAVQEEVQFVFNNISPVFDTVLKYGFEGLKQYFGIGVTTTTPQPPPQPQPEPEPMVAPVVTRKPALVYHSNRTQPVGLPALQSQPAFVQVTKATPASEDNDNDNDNDGATEIMNAE